MTEDTRKCRFEIFIKRDKKFYCAVRNGHNGWAYLWAHDDLHDPCKGCKLFVAGNPTVVSNQIGSKEFMTIAGELIREKDWINILKIGMDGS